MAMRESPVENLRMPLLVGSIINYLQLCHWSNPMGSSKLQSTTAIYPLASTANNGIRNGWSNWLVVTPHPLQGSTKEDIGIEQQLYEIVRGKNFVLNCLSWKFTEMIMITNEVISENLVVVKSSMAKSLRVENLLPQNVSSIINYLQ